MCWHLALPPQLHHSLRVLPGMKVHLHLPAMTKPKVFGECRRFHELSDNPDATHPLGPLLSPHSLSRCHGQRGHQGLDEQHSTHLSAQ